MWMIRILLMLGTIALAARSTTKWPCKKFRDLRVPREFNCPGSCMNTSSGKPVNGTLYYNEDSDVCLASLHAGALNLNGGTVKVQKEYVNLNNNGRGGRILGTCRNRVCSGHIESSGDLYKVSETAKVINGKIGGSMMLIHNNYYQDTLKFMCLSEDSGTRDRGPEILRWNYRTSRYPEINELGYYESPGSANNHAFHCKGESVASDVLASMSFDYGKISTHHTWRANKGEDLTVSIVTNFPFSNPKLMKLPNAEVSISSRSQSESGQDVHSFSITHMTADKSGIYYLDFDEKKIRERGNKNNHEPYFDIIVRDCEAGKFGVDCKKQCPSCKNGGQCHSYTGECLCPPGFIGLECQYACPEGRFGTACQFLCSNTTQKLSTEDQGSCKGLTMCQPRPMGCSCFPGFTGPLCNEECSPGNFGAGCLGVCEDKCRNSDCDRLTGSCNDDRLNGPTAAAPTDVEINKDFQVSWKGDYNNGQNIYFAQIKVKETCNSGPIREPLFLVEEKNLSKQLPQEMLRNSKFEVCVTTSDSQRGLSSPTCITHVNPKELKVELKQPRCYLLDEQKDLRCGVKVQSDCLKIFEGSFSVDFSLSSFLACNDTTISLSGSGKQIQDMWYELIFPNIIPGINYNATASLFYNGNVIEQFPFEAKVASRPPPKLENLTATVLGRDTVRFLWNDPCPSNGEIDQYYFRYSSSASKDYVSRSKAICPKTINYERCFTANSWSYGNHYSGGDSTYYAQAGTSDGQWGEATPFNFLMKLSKPSAPGISLPEDGSNDVTILPPIEPGGKLTNCSVKIGEKSCLKPYTEEEYMTCQFEDIEPGIILKVKASCCNYHFCGEEEEKELATKPNPQLVRNIGVKKKTNSSVTISLPEITREGEGNSSFLIVVKRVDSDNKERKELQEEDAKRIRDSNDHHGRINCSEKQSWIAAEMPSDTQNFEVGDGKSYGDYFNCPLMEGKNYTIGVLTSTKLLDMEANLWQKLDHVTVQPNSSGANDAVIILIVALLLMLIVLLVFMYRSKDKLGKMKSDASEAFSRLIAPTPLAPSSSRVDPHLHPQPPTINMGSLHGACGGNMEGDESIYANVPSGSTVSRRIPRCEIEGYLNMTINTQTALKEFKTVPENLKPMTIGALPINKKKNRYRNNLPYDETRVKLSPIGNDPSSDYINANHIRGYSSINYIATQGPKHQSDSTIKDFWRMIVEQQISAIIMVANFEESGKIKVGQYMKHGETLHFDNYSIQVASFLQQPYFAVSQIQVFVDGNPIHNVTHYHYTNWPDHGVPDEAYSIASLIAFFLDNHDNGGVVVHCSAGIGRTGTVLMALLLHEMLMVDEGIEPIEVLTRLRNGRGRLVENIEQYNFSLLIIEEILFGNITTFTSADLQSNMKSIVGRAAQEYERAKALPTPLSYKYSNMESLRHFNRNPNILPPDNNRIYLQMTDGKEESQYINAVSIHGINREDSILVTEHPLKHTQDRFWRMIMEKRCPFFVLLNNYAANATDEFPPLLPENGREMNVSGYKISMCSPVPSGPDLMQYSLTVRNSRGQRHTLTAYVVQNWEFGTILPESHVVLLNLVDRLLHPSRESKAGPPLLCCGDGVTGCGLLAGLTFVLKRAQTEQVFDIYRSVVKLLRCRYQFITCVEQYELLYTASCDYLNEFSIYANFG